MISSETADHDGGDGVVCGCGSGGGSVQGHGDSGVLSGQPLAAYPGIATLLAPVRNII